MSRVVAVLSGGRSSEHAVSVVSGESVASSLDPARYEVTRVHIDPDGRWSVDGRAVALVPGPDARGALIGDDPADARPVDVVFPVLHGPFGEDGTVQGLCEMAGTPYVGAGVAASAVAMDKALCKVVLSDAGIPTAAGTVVSADEWRRAPEAARERVGDLIGYPAFCKPARLGSSVGISPVPGPGDLDAALDLALRHDPKALVERAIEGEEVEVGVLGNEELTVSPVGQITYDADWYDYETKYEPGRMKLVVPANISKETADRVRSLASDAYRAIECAGLARIDFFATRDGEVLVSEINTLPGFTPTSVYASLMAAGGIAYGPLVDRLIDLGVERARAAREYRN